MAESVETLSFKLIADPSGLAGGAGMALAFLSEVEGVANDFHVNPAPYNEAAFRLGTSFGELFNRGIKANPTQLRDLVVGTIGDLLPASAVNKFIQNFSGQLRGVQERFNREGRAGEALQIQQLRQDRSTLLRPASARTFDPKTFEPVGHNARLAQLAGITLSPELNSKDKLDQAAARRQIDNARIAALREVDRQLSAALSRSGVPLADINRELATPPAPVAPPTSPGRGRGSGGGQPPVTPTAPAAPEPPERPKPKKASEVAAEVAAEVANRNTGYTLSRQADLLFESKVNSLNRTLTKSEAQGREGIPVGSEQLLAREVQRLQVERGTWEGRQEGLARSPFQGDMEALAKSKSTTATTNSAIKAEAQRRVDKDRDAALDANLKLAQEVLKLEQGHESRYMALARAERAREEALAKGGAQAEAASRVTPMSAETRRQIPASVWAALDAEKAKADGDALRRSTNAATAAAMEQAKRAGTGDLFGGDPLKVKAVNVEANAANQANNAEALRRTTESRAAAWNREAELATKILRLEEGIENDMRAVARADERRRQAAAAHKRATDEAARTGATPPAALPAYTPIPRETLDQIPLQIRQSAEAQVMAERRAQQQAESRARLQTYLAQPELRASERWGATLFGRAPTDPNQRSGIGGLKQEFTEGFLGSQERLTFQAGQTAKFSLFYGGAYAVLNQLEQGFSAAARGALQYQDALEQLVIVTGKSTQENAALADAAGRVGTALGLGAAEGVSGYARALGLYDLTEAAPEVQQQVGMQSTEVAGRLAVVSKGDFAQIQTQLAGLVRSFPEDTSQFDQPRIEDMLALVARKTGRPANELLTAVTQIGDLANTAGYGLSDTLAMVAQVTSQTAQTPEAVAGFLSQIFGKANDPASERALAQVGVNVQGTSMAEQFTQLSELYKSGSVSTEALTQLIQQFGRGRSGQALGIILNRQDEIQTLATAAENAPAGSGRKQFEQIMSSITGQLKLLGGEALQLGKDLAQTGFLDFLYVLVRTARVVVQALDHVVVAFNSIPHALRDVVAWIVTMRIASGLLAASGFANAAAIVGGLGGVGGVGGLRGGLRAAAPAAGSVTARSTWGAVGSAIGAYATGGRRGQTFAASNAALRAAERAAAPVAATNASRVAATAASGVVPIFRGGPVVTPVSSAASMGSAPAAFARSALSAEVVAANAAASAAATRAATQAAAQGAERGLLGRAAAGGGAILATRGALFGALKSAIGPASIVLGPALGIRGALKDTAAGQATLDEARGQVASSASVQDMETASKGLREAANAALQEQSFSWSDAFTNLNIAPLLNKLPQSGFTDALGITADSRYQEAMDAKKALDERIAALKPAEERAALQSPEATFDNFGTTDAVTAALADLGVKGFSAAERLKLVNKAFDDLVDRAGGTVGAVGKITKGGGEAFALSMAGMAGDARTGLIKFLSDQASDLEGSAGSPGPGRGRRGPSQRDLEAARLKAIADQIRSDPQAANLNENVSDAVSAKLRALRKDASASDAILTAEDMKALQQTVTDTLIESLGEKFKALPQKTQEAYVGMQMRRLIAANTGGYANVRLTPLQVANATAASMQAATATTENAFRGQELEAGETALAGLQATRATAVAALKAFDARHAADNPTITNSDDAAQALKDDAKFKADRRAMEGSIDALDKQIDTLYGSLIQQRQARGAAAVALAQSALAPGDLVGRNQAELDQIAIDLADAIANGGTNEDIDAIKTRQNNAQAKMDSDVRDAARSNALAGIDPLNVTAALSKQMDDALDDVQRTKPKAGQEPSKEHGDAVARAAQLAESQRQNALDIFAATNAANRAPDDTLQAANDTLAEAQRAFDDVSGRGLEKTAEYQKRKAALAQAQYDEAITMAQYLAADRLAGIDQTDPTAAAAESLKEFMGRYDAASPAGKRLMEPEKKRQEQAARIARDRQNLKDVNDMHDIGATSDAAFIASLAQQASFFKATRDAIGKGNNGWREYNDLWIDAQKQLKSATKGFDRQFNIGNIKLPTVYEIRRAMGSGAQEMASRVSDYSHSGNTVNINGADLTTVINYIRQYLGQNAQIVTTPAGRRP